MPKSDEINFLTEIDADVTKEILNRPVTVVCDNLSNSIDDEIIAELIVKEPPTKKQKLNDPQPTYNVMSIVSAHPIGDALLKISKVKQKFTSLHQSYLVDLIVTHFYTLKM